MNFSGTGKSRIALCVGSACLFGCLLWQFAAGDNAMIRTGFTPVNDQMEQLVTTYEAQVQDTPAVSTTTTPAPDTAAALPPHAAEVTPAPVLPHAAEVTPDSSASKLNAKPLQRLDLNTATIEQLDSLPGIGASKAQAIVDYRTKKGRFRRIEELTDVKGIGDKMLEKLKVLLYVSEP